MCDVYFLFLKSFISVLTTSQQEVLSLLHSFFKNSSINTFILKGYAGTGKTFLMQHLAKELQENKASFSFLATTGRAATVLNGKTGFNARTVHGELYHFHEVNGDNENIPKNAPIDSFGQMKLIFNLRQKDESDRLYIIDESSMLSTEVLDDTSYAEFGSGNLLSDLLNVLGNNKVIFVGDPCQLPPVGQSFSPALDEGFLTNIGRTVLVGELTEIVRMKSDNDILLLAQEIRNMISSVNLPKWSKLPASNRNNCTVHSSEKALLDEYLRQFSKQDKTDFIAIAQSNKMCNRINETVRSHLYKKDHAPLHVGDILMVTQNNYLIPLTNGDFVQVTAIGAPRSEANLHFQSVRIKHLLTEKEFEILLAMDVLYGNLSNLSKEQQRMLMINFSNRMRNKSIIPNSNSYKENMKVDPYLNSLRATFGYAVTCHKSQGGEWNEVFLFLQKGMYSMPQNDMLRWWYTAITRTKDRLHLGYDWWIQ